jgi:enterochelin esterase-like enzyme
MTTKKGDLVTATLPYDGGRLVSVYVPVVRPEAVIYAGDGQLIAAWGEIIEASGAPPTMIVGAHRSPDDTHRLHEYSLDFDPDRFAAHERFFVNDLRAWVLKQFGVNRPNTHTAVFGVSAGGELALALGLRHPAVYGSIFCASPGGGYRPPDVLSSPLPRAYFVAGNQEPFFLDNAVRWKDALHKGGADAVMTKRAGGHGGDFWRTELPLMAIWAFGSCSFASKGR